LSHRITEYFTVVEPKGLKRHGCHGFLTADAGRIATFLDKVEPFIVSVQNPQARHLLQGASWRIDRRVFPRFWPFWVAACWPIFGSQQLGTLWLFNIAMVNGPFIDGLNGLPVYLLKMVDLSIYRWSTLSSLAMPFCNPLRMVETSELEFSGGFVNRVISTP